MDFGFQLPDEVHALAYTERYLRSRSNHDLCSLDETRFFVRGIVSLPLRESDDSFCWGLWVELDRAAHDAYVDGFDADLSGTPAVEGRLANDLPGHGGTRGLAVAIQFGAAGERPAFRFPADASHVLATDQREGLSGERHHDILEAVGYFKPRAAAGMPAGAQAWPFEALHDTTCYVDRRILEGSHPILRFACEPTDEMGQHVYHAMTGEALDDSTVIAIVCLDHVLSLDPGLAAVARLPVGWEALRDDPGACWTSRPIPDDDDDGPPANVCFSGH